MKKHELLVPAGDMECLRQAVFHGADAVYLACKNFGARKFATNFSNEEIVEAIRFCHLYGVKLYVTMNTLIHNSEVDSFIEQARFLHKNGVDALIVQDFGMICLLRRKFPNLEIHASTQANNSSYETCQMFYELGVKRVVFSRELSIDEIDAIDVPIEKEAFIHGALCVSYSGCCLMSSMNGGRSGNRGECAGSCRLPYSLYKNHKEIRKSCYLLSMKELNTSSRIERLLDSSIYSFKIEGRMKGPLYVAFITDFYRKLIDGVPVDFQEKTKELKTIFNREFTLGHLFGENNGKLINSNSPNHIGLEIGKATIKKNKILLSLNPGCILRQYDSIRFLHSNKGMVVNYLYDKKDNLCNESTDICMVDNKVQLDQDDILMKTQDSVLEKNTIVQDSLYKVPVQFFVKAKLGEKLEMSIQDGDNIVSLSAGIVDSVKNIPTTEDDITSKLRKLGNTPFEFCDAHFEMDSNVFVPMKVVNDVRRDLVSLLEEKRVSIPNVFAENDFQFEKENHSNEGYSGGLVAYVYTEEQLKACIHLSFQRIYVSSFELYEKYKENESVYYDVGRCYPSYGDRVVSKNYVSDYFRYSHFSNRKFYGSYFLNVTNIYTAYFLKGLGLCNIPLSVELTESEINEFIRLYHEKVGTSLFEVFLYGRVENMIIQGNILDLSKGDFSYDIVDIKKKSFPVYFDGDKTHIYHSENKRGEIALSGCDWVFYFYDESFEDVQNAVKSFLS